jgi:predicted transposase YdaD
VFGAFRDLFMVTPEDIEESWNMPYVTSIERRARQEGLQEGIQEGLQQEGILRGLIKRLERLGRESLRSP